MYKEEYKMIEEDRNQPIQATHMEASLLLAEAINKATRLGFSLYCSGGDIAVHLWAGKPIYNEIKGDSIYDAEYITNLLDWLDGVSYGRTNLGKP